MHSGHPAPAAVLEKMKRIGLSLCVAGLALSIGAGCAGRKAAWQDKNTENADSATATAAESDPNMAAAEGHWAKRTDPNEIRQAISSWEKAVEANPKNVEALSMLVRANYFLADGYLRGDEKAYLEHMDKAVGWGEKALIAASPEFEEKMRNKAKFYEAVTVVGKEGVPAMYWYSAALGKWARAKSFAVLVGQKDNVKAAMDRVMELDAGFFYAGPDRYFGAFYSVAPAFAGGDLDKSQEHFDKSLAVAPNYLGTKVLMAENLAVKLDDEDKFKAWLQEVLDGDPKGIPELEPEALVEQQKAKELLENIDEYF